MKPPIKFPAILAILLLLTVSSRAAELKQCRILIHMLPEQQAWFIKNILRPFEKQNKCEIQVTSYGDIQEAEKLLSDSANRFEAVKVPFSDANDLVNRKLVKSLNELLDSTRLQKLQDEYAFFNLCKFNDKYYFFPRKLESRIMVYRPSKVKEAAANWRKYIPDINQLLSGYSGIKLPDDYTLEPDPNRWDYFDVLVAGTVWAKTPVKGAYHGRVANRGKKYRGTFINLIDRTYSFGGTQDDIRSPESKNGINALEWEWMYARSGVYNPAMWEKAWSGEDIWKAFGDEEVFLSFLTQIDCIFLHGNPDIKLKGAMKNPEDLGFAIMPKAALLADEFNPLLNRNVSTGGWLWGIPSSSGDEKLSLDLIAFITSDANQKKECSVFGTLPVKTALLSSYSDFMMQKWKNDLVTATYRQINLNKYGIIPYFDNMQEMEDRWLSIWYGLCMHPEKVTNRESLVNFIHSAQ